MTNCGNERFAFLASAIKEGRTDRRRRVQLQLGLNNQKTIFEFGLPDIIAHSQRNITAPRPAHSCRRFLQDSFILSFSCKNMTHGTLPNCLLSNPLQSHRFQIRNSAYKSGLCISSKYISCSRRGKHIVPLFPRFCSKRSNQAVCT